MNGTCCGQELSGLGDCWELYRGKGVSPLILPQLHSLLWFLKASSSFIPSASSSLRATSISFSRRWML